MAPNLLTLIRRRGRSVGDAGLACALVAAGLMATRPSRAFTPPGRYSYGIGTVLDTQTNLIWQTAPEAASSSWNDAVSTCQGLNLGGVYGWRLPTVGELESIVDDSRSAPAVDPTTFPNTPVDVDFWTSSNVVGVGSTYGWAVSFQDGSSTFHFRSDLLHVRCVLTSH